LILLSGDSPHLSSIREREGYAETELIKASDIKVFIAEESGIMLPSHKKKSKVKMLVPVSVNNESGILSSSFDEVINEMNRIADDIMFGG